MRQLFFCCVVCLSCLFAAGNATAEVLAKSSNSWDGTSLPAYPKEAPYLSVVKITIPPHTTLPMHRHPIINAGYMLKGVLTVVNDANQTLRLNAGDAIIEVVNQWHYGVNDGDEPVEIVVFYAGDQESPYSILR